jgi:hypothetical protein
MPTITTKDGAKIFYKDSVRAHCTRKGVVIGMQVPRPGVFLSRKYASRILNLGGAAVY